MTDTAAVIAQAQTTAATAAAIAAAVPAATDKTWAKLVAFVRKWSGYALLLEPVWIKWYQLVASRPKLFAAVIVMLALLALR